MEKSEIFKLMRAKVEAMWQIATHDACGKRLSAVADLHLQVSMLSQQMDNSYPEEN